MTGENPIVKIEIWDIISAPTPNKTENQLAEFFMWWIQELKKTNTIKGIFGGTKADAKNMISKSISDKEDKLISTTWDMEMTWG